MTEIRDSRPPGILSPDQQSALKSMADARNKIDTSASSPEAATSTRPSRRGLLKLMGGALAALGLGAGLASSQSGRNQTEAAPSVSPVPTTIPDGEGEENNGMPPNWDSYGQAKPVYAPAAEVPPLTDEQVTSKDKKNEVKPHSAGTDGNKYGENGEDILPMMKPVNPSTIADKGTSAG